VRVFNLQVDDRLSNGAFTIDSSTPTLTGNFNEHLINLLGHLSNMIELHSYKSLQQILFEANYSLLLKLLFLFNVSAQENANFVFHLPSHKMIWQHNYLLSRSFFPDIVKN
jgi:hypothetical protein